jgi:dephospho-CoA kinase
LIIIGLTGGIGTGKSKASEYLQSLGAAVWDADRAARAVVEQGHEGWKAIRREFGAEYFDSAGNLLRKKLADRIFSSGEDRERVNALLHPAILDEMQRWLARMLGEGAALAVVDAPLLFESGADRFVDETWVLSCGVDEQVRRVMERGLSREEAEKRVESQMSDTERKRRAQRVIDTSGPIEDTRRQLKALYEEALAGELR